MNDNQQFDYKNSWFELYKSKSWALVENMRTLQIAHINAIVEYSKLAIRGSFLLNGVAAMTMLYNIEAIGKKGYTPLMECCLGALCAVICAGLSYVAQRLYFIHEIENIHKTIIYFYSAIEDIMANNSTKKQPHTWGKPYIAHFFSVVACLSWLASVYFFCYACSNAAQLVWDAP